MRHAVDETKRCHLCRMEAIDICSTCGRPVCISHRGFVGGRTVCISCLMLFDGFLLGGMKQPVEKFTKFLERICHWPFRTR